MSAPRPKKFFIFGTAIFALSALILVAFGPDIKSAQAKAVDNLIGRAQTAAKAGDKQLFLLYLRQAEAIDPFDVGARTLHAQHYQAAGDYARAIAIYEGGGVSPNAAYLGKLALKAQDYRRAEKYFTAASKEGSKTSGLAGKAISLFNQNKVTAGCDAAAQAHKLDINNPDAERAAKLCLVLAKESTDHASNISLTPPDLSTKRQRAYFLIDNGVLTTGERELEASVENTPADWLLLATLASGRRDYQKAQIAVEQGLTLDRSNWELLNLAVVIYEKLAAQTSGQKRAEYQKISDEKKHVIPYIPKKSTRGP